MATALASAQPAPRQWKLRLPARLPNLKGKWLTAYTVLWAILLPLAIFGAVKGTYIGVTTPTMWSPYGFSTSQDSRGLHVDAVGSAQVGAKGVHPDDYVVAVDGWTLPPTAARAAARPHVIKPNGSFTSFTFRHADGKLYSVRLERSVRIEQEAFRAAGVNRTFVRTFGVAFGALVPLLLLISAILLFMKRRREAVPAMLSIAFLLFAGTVSSSDLLGVNQWVVGLASIVAVIIMFQVFFAFPSGRFEPRWTAILFLLAPSFVIFLFYPDAQAAGSLLGAAFFVCALTSLVVRYRKLEAGAERQQLRWAFFGLAVCAVSQLLGLAFNLAVNAWQADDPRWNIWAYFIGYLGDISFYGMIVGLLVSILRYRLYDADAVIGRSVGYAVLTLGFVAFFAASEKIIELLGQEYLGQNIGSLAGGVAAALAAVAIAPMHHRTHRWAEKRFQKGLYRLRNALPPLVGDLRETAGLEQIAGAALDAIVAGVRARHAALIAGETVIDAREISAGDVEEWRRNWTPASHEGIDCNRSDPVFPIRVPLEAEGHGRVGWLLLGSRPDGSLFGKSECDAIENIAEPVARAVEVALRRQERERQIESRLQRVETEVRRTSAKLGELLKLGRPLQAGIGRARN